MKRLANKSLALLLALLMAVSTMSGLAMAAEETNADGITPLASSGTCGTNVSWVLDDDWILTISGEGAMTNFAYTTSVPWYGSRSSISKIVIEEGVTSIGSNAFWDCWKITSVSIASTVTSIGSQAFFTTGYANDVTVTFAGDAPTTIASDAFQGAKVTAYYPSGNSTWTSSVKQNYGGTITWEEYDLPESTDKTELKNAIDAAEALDQSDYTTESWSALEKALTEARSVYSNASATEEEVKQAADNLNAAIENLVKGAEKADLKAAIEKAEDLDEAMYTSDSWAVLQNALKEAIAVRDNADASQDEVDLAAKNLESAIDALEPIDNQCGPNLTWTLDEEGNLTITGTGTMYDYDPATNPAPWTGMNVVTLTIEEGATSIGTYAFTGLTTLTYADITDTVLSVGDYAFAGDSGLEYIMFSGDNGTAPTFGGSSFSEVTAVAYYPDNSAWKEVIGSNYGGTITWVEYMVGMHAHEFQFYWYPSDGGYTRFKVCLFDEDGNALSGHNTSAQFTSGIHDDGDSTSYTFSIADFVNSYVVIDEAGYNFSYATVSDPNITDTEHEHYEGMQAQYGSSIDPVDTIKLHWTKDAAATSKTWHYTMFCRNGNEYTVGIYGNQDGASDGYAWSPYSLELNLYFEEETIIADKTALEEAIAAAENLTESDYTPSSWSAMQTALTAAKEVYADGNASQTDVDNATAALVEAVVNLVEKADKTALETAIAEAKTYKEEDYTPASWTVLQDALTAAEALDADGDAAQGEVDYATAALNNAIAALVKAEAADKAALEAAIAEAETYKEADYTVASWEALQDALKAAKEIDADGDAAQEDVDKATTALNEAIKGLVKSSTDKTDLEALIDQAKGLNEVQYTAESWSAMQAVLATAEEIYNNGDASQEAVDAAAKSLEAAINDLVLHTHEFVGTVTEPTCMVGGYTTYTCSICGATYVSDYKDAVGHSYESAVTNPTCTTGGYTTYTCSRCNDSYVSDYTDALGHSYTGLVTDPTCTTGGYTTYTCSRCSDSYVGNYTSALGHSYESNVTEPTCTTGGYTIYTCSRCNDSYVGNYTSALGHSYESNVTEPTCTTGGYTTYTCSRCNDNYVSDYTDALGHSYESAVTNPTCLTGGYTTYTCSRCNDSYVSDYTDALGHAWDEGVVTTEPTCTEDGVMTYTCTRCETTRTEIIANTGHDYVTADVKEPTCTEAGYTTYTCSICGDSYVGDYTDALGHAWDEGVVTTEPTCEEEGVMTYTCTRCGATSTVAIARTAHDYVGVMTDPTCTKAGYTTYTCSVCGAEYVSDYTNALGHQWDDGVVTKEPTATEQGEITYTCTVCGATYTEAIPPTGSEESSPDSGTQGPGPELFTGFASMEGDGNWYYYIDSAIAYDLNSVVYGTVNGADGWWYVVGGQVRLSFTGLAEYGNEYGWWYIENGRVNFDHNCVDHNSYGWWYVVGSQVQFGFTGLAEYGNEYGWWYIENGKVNFDHNCVDHNSNGWWYVVGSQVQFSFTGLANYGNEYGWWYIENGRVNFDFNGVEQNNYGWWYIVGSQVQFGYTGVANYGNAYGWWYIASGKVDFSFTGLASNNYGTWYIKAGKVDFSYNGTCNGRTIAAGKAV